MGKRTAVSPEATAKYDADVALAGRFDDLFAQAQSAEQALRDAQAHRAPAEECPYVVLARRMGRSRAAFQRMPGLSSSSALSREMPDWNGQAWLKTGKTSSVNS